MHKTYFSVSCLETKQPTYKSGGKTSFYVAATSQLVCIADLIAFSHCHSIRTHGLNGNALWDITCATLVSQLQYACPAWWGYLKADERNRLKSIVSKAIRYGFLLHSFCTLDELREDADEKTLLLIKI